ncbi:MAG: GMC family oxidoreductase N-terminal domain-containing protein [Steroidobacteraceae bacterium]|jgi:choline dehydrogenase|nr:GMC family oxidoreductase N-terminal domain-containing protein [Steroidobacteraceae bacterium]
METWDYVVVGGGSAGCVLANRLSADPSIRVLLLEAGDADRSPYIHVPAAIIRCVGNPSLDWCLLAEPDPTRHGKVDLWPAGKTLGGSSSINGMLFVRGAHADFDRWAALGNPGWSWSEVLPLFRRLENSEVGDDALRGRDGALHVSRLRTTHPLGKVFVAAARECGIPHNPDYNGASQEGVAEPQVTQRGGWRWSAARAFIAPARRRPNLRIVTGCTAEALLLEGGRCVGVRARRRDGSTAQFRASGEVLVASGTLGSPKLLMLSGLGPGAALRALGLPVLRDLPGVGANLQEHCNSLVCADVNVPTYNTESTGPRMLRHLARWIVAGDGPASSPYPHGVAFLRSRPEEPRPDLQMLFGPFAFDFDERGIIPYGKPAVSFVVNACHPESRGRLRLRSADPSAPPLIEHRLLDSDEDLRRQVAGCRIARRILGAPAFRPYVEREFLPGPGREDDAALADHVRRTSFLGYHPVGTCRMGPDEAAVVTPRLQVHGVAGLRVVDASIMPRQVAANTNAAAMMIGEKGAELVLAERRMSRAA